MGRARIPRLSGQRLLLAVLLAGLALLGTPTPTLAHPLGNFTVNRYTRLEPGSAAIELRYILDMAEIPAFQERARIDADGDGAISAAEQQRYAEAKLADLQGNLHLLLGGQPLALEPHEHLLEFPAGQGGLSTLRLSARFVAALPASGGEWLAEYRDDNYPGRLGWQEVVVRPAAGIGLIESSAPAQDQSQELRVYPEDMLQSPLTVSSAQFRFRPASVNWGLSGDPVVNPKSEIQNPKSEDRFAALIAAPINGPGGLLVALLIAFGLGAAHALAPGHGKTIVAAYLVGSRGTARHALFLGLTTTITHTAGVFALGLITLFVSRYILPEQLYPWLGVVSGLIVVTIGVALFTGRLRLLSGGQGHAHAHDHDHEQLVGSDGRLMHTHGALGTPHTHAPPSAGPITWRGLLALGISGGLLPCPSALVVLLSAIALGRVGLGLTLIVAFSLGLAGVLTLIGMLLVYAGRLFERLPRQGRLLRTLPLVSALVVTLLGVGITLQALVQTGIITRQ